MKFNYKFFLIILSILSFLFITNMDYDKSFRSTLFLPLAFGLGIFWLYNAKKYEYGPCSIALSIFYAFRMNILPVICVWGNFYMELSKPQYIAYYDMGIFLMCIEFFIVLFSMNYFSFKNKNKITLLPKYKHKIIQIIAISFAIIIVLGVIYVDPYYFHFFYDEIGREFLDSNIEHRGIWYLMDLICTLGRPLISFVLLFYGLKIRRFYGWSIVVLVIVYNFLFLSERRIFSLLISGVCLYYVMTIIKSKFVITSMEIVLILSTVLAVYINFYFQIGEGKLMISRTFEHYFSGPSLTAIGLAANNSVDYETSEFFKLLFNDFQVMTALFKKIPVENMYDKVFGFSKGIWTPMFVGGIRYFGLLAPLFIIAFVKFVTYCDFKSKNIDDELIQIIYIFLGVTVSCYMVMYKLELIVYFLLSTALIYHLIIKYCERHGEKKRCRKNY